MSYGHKRLAIVTFLLSAAVAAFAQGPPPGGNAWPPMPKPQNLKILPEDISTSDLIALMKQYNGQLGVECGYCHAGDPATHRLNFASDTKPEKGAARIMMTMTAELNAKYVSTIPGYMGGKVVCGTCHRGHSMPEQFVPSPEEPEKH